MIAEVYPVRRMPRRFHVFDYAVPEGMEIRRGSAVRVPFRTSSAFAYVGKVKEKSDAPGAVKIILERVPKWDLADQELEYFEKISQDLVQSVSSILHAAIPRPLRRPRTNTAPALHQPLMVPSNEAQGMRLLVQRLRETTGIVFTQVPDLRRSAAIIAGLARDRKGGMIILAPNVRDAKTLFAHLGETHPLLLTGEESASTRAAAWQSFRAQKNGVLIATRLGVLFPHPNLGVIVVVRAGHPNHKQADQNPRYDTLRLAPILASASRARCIFLDVLPRADLLTTATSIPNAFPYSPPIIISFLADRKLASHPAIMPAALDAIQAALERKKQVLCIYNRKGMSHHLACRDCGHAFPCPKCGGPLVVYERDLRCHRCRHSESVPLACPSCRSTEFSRRGFGNRQIAMALEHLCPGSRVHVIEKDRPGSDDTAPILLVTRYYLEQLFDPFHPPPFGCVVELNADAPLFQPTFRSTEEALLSAYEWTGIANASGAPFFLQTQFPDLFRDAFRDPLTVLKNELELRRTYRQPPFVRWVRVEARGAGATNAIQELAHDLRTHVTGVELQISNSSLLCILAEQNVEELLARFSNLDDRYIIDTHADI